MIRTSAPGKCIVMGEHAAVYGCPALVTAIGLRTTAELEPRPGDRVVLDLPQIGVREEVSWAEILSYTAQVRDAWLHYAEDPGPERFAGVRGEDPAHLIKVALGEAAGHLGDTVPPGLVLRASTEIPIGAGFGSSASATVAVVDAYLALRGTTLSHAELEALTLEVERRQHGMPSGVDNATVLHGGLVWAERDADGVLHAAPLDSEAPLLERFRLVHTGTPAETTGACVASVRRLKEAEPERVAALLERVESNTRALREALTGAKEDAQARIVELVRDGEACLEELGVVPPDIREAVRELERRGASVKISGAGALTGAGAGALLVLAPDGEDLDSWEELARFDVLDLRLGAEGLRRE